MVNKALIGKPFRAAPLSVAPPAGSLGMRRSGGARARLGTESMDVARGPVPALVVAELHKRFGDLEVLKGVSLTALTAT